MTVFVVDILESRCIAARIQAASNKLLSFDFQCDVKGLSLKRLIAIVLIVLVNRCPSLKDLVQQILVHVVSDVAVILHFIQKNVK